MRTAKLIGNGLLSLSLVCWIVGCNAEEETSPSTTGPTTTTPTVSPHGAGADHEHAEGEDHEHAEGEDHEHAEGDADHDHAEEATEGDDTATETEGDAQASLELPEPVVTGVEETNLDLPVVEAGSGT